MFDSNGAYIAQSTFEHTTREAAHQIHMQRELQQQAIKREADDKARAAMLAEKAAIKARKQAQREKHLARVKAIKPEDVKKYDREKLAILFAISNMGGESAIDSAIEEEHTDAIKFAEQQWFESLAESSAESEVETNTTLDREINSWKRELKEMTDSDVDKLLQHHPDSWTSLVLKPTNYHVYFAGGDEDDMVDMGVVKATNQKAAIAEWWKRANNDEKAAIGNDIKALGAADADDVWIKGLPGGKNVVSFDLPHDYRFNKDVKEEEYGSTGEWRNVERFNTKKGEWETVPRYCEYDGEEWHPVSDYDDEDD
jgi:hypothetical protein